MAGAVALFLGAFVAPIAIATGPALLGPHPARATESASAAAPDDAFAARLKRDLAPLAGAAWQVAARVERDVRDAGASGLTVGSRLRAVPARVAALGGEARGALASRIAKASYTGRLARTGRDLAGLLPLVTAPADPALRSEARALARIAAIAPDRILLERPHAYEVQLDELHTAGTLADAAAPDIRYAGLDPFVPAATELPAVAAPPAVSAGDSSAQAGPAAAAKRSALPELDCVIEPDETVDLGAAAAGVLDVILVERSDTVEAGQVVAQLESGVEAASVALARARAAMDDAIRSREEAVTLGEKRVARNARLYERRALSLEAKEEAETEARVAGLDLERARDEQRLASLELDRALRALERRSVVAPISGVVVERFLSPGELVNNEPILRIARIDPLEVEVIAPADLFGRIHPGMRAEVRPEAPASGNHEATVHIVDRLIDAASGTFGVRLALPNPDHGIPGGLGCKIRFVAD